MIGSLLIILSYCIIPGIRTKGREILVNLSLMDFLAAASNCAGIAVNFNHYLGNSSENSNSSHVIDHLCVAQAVFAQYGTISSILWTICLAVYIYLCIMVANKKVAFRSVLAFYVLSYGLPAIISAWYVSTKKLGFDKIGGSGWCSVIVESNGKRQLLSIIFTNDIWIYLTMVIVPVIFVALHYHLKHEVSVLPLNPLNPLPPSTPSPLNPLPPSTPSPPQPPPPLTPSPLNPHYQMGWV
jgi:G protein-coupled receptor 157